MALSGVPSTLWGSTSSDQSILAAESHCLSLPFWYRSSRCRRPSSYSHVKRASPASGTSQVDLDTGLLYKSWVDMDAPRRGEPGPTAGDVRRTPDVRCTSPCHAGRTGVNGPENGTGER